MSEVKGIKNACSSGERLSLTLLSAAMVLYFTFIYQTVWNWFIADYLFEISYWEMFLGAFIIRFIVSPNKKYSDIKIEEVNNKKLDFSTRLENRFFYIVGNTLLFGIFFIINLIIAYYG